MYTIDNDLLSVSLLDPIADGALLGSRYCTGGFIWQMVHRQYGTMLSGPQFPDFRPSPFHGQGAPEAFVLPLGIDTGIPGSSVVVMGVGEVQRTSDVHPFHPRDNPVVREFCDWSVEVQPQKITMSSAQKTGEYAIGIVRRVWLEENSVVSDTELVNESDVEIQFRWFAHPFFPLSADLRCCMMKFQWNVEKNDGYIKNRDGILCMKEEYPWKKGLFMKLDFWSEAPLSARMFHPVAPMVTITTDFVPESLPVWANDRTFSIEPYRSGVVKPGERTRWKIIYTIA